MRQGVYDFNDDLQATADRHLILNYSLNSVELRNSEEITKNKAFYSVKERWMEKQAKERLSGEKVSCHNNPFCYFMC